MILSTIKTRDFMALKIRAWSCAREQHDNNQNRKLINNPPRSRVFTRPTLRRGLFEKGGADWDSSLQGGPNAAPGDYEADPSLSADGALYIDLPQGGVGGR